MPEYLANGKARRYCQCLGTQGQALRDWRIMCFPKTDTPAKSWRSKRTNGHVALFYCSAYSPMVTGEEIEMFPLLSYVNVAFERFKVELFTIRMSAKYFISHLG